MARRPRRAPRLRRALTLAILLAAIVAAAATVSSRTDPRHADTVALPADPDAPGRLMPPAALAAPTVGPPLYPAKNTDGQAGSGPVAVAYHDRRRTITDAAVTAQAPDPRLFNTGYGGWEPTIGITKDGTI